MIEFFRGLLSSDFMPHGTCYLWNPGVLWLNVISDGLIALSYYAIPLVLLSFFRKRRDLEFRWIFVAFALFILACGTTHLMSVWTVWHATYRLDGLVKAITAFASILTAVMLVPLLPELVALPSPGQLARANTALASEVEERKAAEEQVRSANTGLELRVAARTAELRASMDRYRFLADSMPQIVWTSSPEGRIDFLNQRWRTYTGTLSLRWEDSIHPEDLPPFLDQLNGSLRTGREWEALVRIRAADGRYRWHLSRVVPMHAASGEIEEWVGTSTDVDEAQRTAQELRRAHHELQTVIETTPLGIYSIDVQGKVTTWNLAAGQMLASPSGHATGDTGEILETLRRTGAIANRERQIAQPDGTVLEVAEWISPLRTEQGEIRGALCVVADNTERKRLQEQLLQAQKMEAIGRLAGGIAHDFNNLLTVISGFNEMLSEGIAELPGLADYAAEVRNAARRASDLTSQLLAFSRRQLAQPRVLDLNEIVSRTEKMLQRLIGEDIELAIAPAPDLGMIEADSGQIEQILLNLAVNARDAMPDGGKLTIETANVDLDRAYTDSHLELKPGQYVQLAVTDNGTGMSAETKDHLFEPFFTTKGQGKGTGLGLSIVYGIVKQNGGSVLVYSELGQGSSFKIYFPRMEPVPAPQQEARTEAVPETGSGTILVVEDEPGLLKLVRNMLEQHGYAILAACTPDEAVTIATDYPERIDLLLTDVVMPQMNGPDLARALTAKRQGMKVIFMSGYAEAGIARHGLLDAGIEFVQKPFTSSALAAKVRSVLRAK